MPNNALSWQDDPSGYLQNAIGAPVTITSGLRTPQHNLAVGGVPNSDHIRGQAYDFVPRGMSMANAAENLAKSGVPTTKILNEGNHVHVSYPTQGNMAQPQGVSDDDILKALTGGASSGPTAKSAAPAQAPSGPSGAASGVTDDQILAALTGGSSAPKNGSGVAAKAVVPAPAAANAAGQLPDPSLPKRFDPNAGIVGSLHVPFVQDIMAGTAALQDVGGNMLSGKSGPGLTDAYHARMNQLQQMQAQFEQQHPAAKSYGWIPGAFAGGAPEAAEQTVANIPRGIKGLAQLALKGAKTGAIVGGVYGAGMPTGQPNETLGDRAGNALTSAAFGAVTGGTLPVAGAGVTAAGRYIGNKASQLFQPVEQAAEQKARNIIDNFSGGGVAPNAAELVPGVKPTLAEASGNPGVSALYRTLRDLNPNSPLVARETQNADARASEAEKLIGTPEDIQSQMEERNAVAGPMREEAFANATDTDVRAVKSAINRVLASPAGQRDVVANSLSKIRDKLELDYPLSERVADAVSPIKDAISSGSLGAGKLEDFVEARRLLNSANRGFTSEDDLVSGLKALAKKQKIVGPIDSALKIIKSGGTKLESDPAQLYGIRQAVGDMLSPMAHGTGSDARLASSELQGVMSSLDNAIERGAPGYQKYMETFSNMSKPANAMEFLQSQKITDSKGNLTLTKVQNLLDKLQKGQNKSGIQNAKSVTDDQVQKLTALRDDLLRKDNINLGKSITSATVQNSMAQQRLGLAKHIDPELAGKAIGGTIGGGIGSMFGMGEGAGGAAVGTSLGGTLGRMAGARAAKKNALFQQAVQGHLENMMLDPQAYQNAAPPAGATSLNDLLNSSRARAAMGVANRLAIMHHLANEQPAR